MSSRQKQTRAKRRAHVQQYSTGSADPALPPNPAPLAPLAAVQPQPQSAVAAQSTAPDPAADHAAANQTALAEQPPLLWDPAWDDKWEEDNWVQSGGSTALKAPVVHGQSHTTQFGRANPYEQKEPENIGFHEHQTNISEAGTRNQNPTPQHGAEQTQEQDWNDWNDDWNDDGTPIDNPYEQEVSEIKVSDAPKPTLQASPFAPEHSPVPLVAPRAQAPGNHWNTDTAENWLNNVNKTSHADSGEKDSAGDLWEDDNWQQQPSHDDNQVQPEQQIDHDEQQEQWEQSPVVSHEQWEQKESQTHGPDQWEQRPQHLHGEDLNQWGQTSHSEHHDHWEEESHSKNRDEENWDYGHEEAVEDQDQFWNDQEQPTEEQHIESQHQWPEDDVEQHPYQSWEHEKPEDPHQSWEHEKPENPQQSWEQDESDQHHEHHENYEHEDFVSHEQIPQHTNPHEPQASEKEEYIEEQKLHVQTWENERQSEYSLDETNEDQFPPQSPGQWESLQNASQENMNTFLHSQNREHASQYPENEELEESDHTAEVVQPETDLDESATDNFAQENQETTDDFFNQIGAEQEQAQSKQFLSHEPKPDAVWQDHVSHKEWNPSNDDLVVYTRNESLHVKADDLFPEEDEFLPPSSSKSEEPYAHEESQVDAPVTEATFAGESEDQNQEEPIQEQQPGPLQPQSEIQEQNETGVQPQETEHSKLKALEMLDLDDDLLLDDDFLEEDDVNVEGNDGAVSEENSNAQVLETLQAPIQTSTPAHTSLRPTEKKLSFASKYSKPAEQSVPKPQYTPQTLVSAPVPPQKVISAATIAEDEMKRKLEASKKKNDAYDLPLNLMPQKPKPASRAASSQTATRPTRPTVAAGPGVGALARSSTSTSEVSTASTSKKAFFEDLPVPAPPKALRPPRAAAAATSAPPVAQQPALPSAPPTASIKSPKNPYAKLAPKNSNPPSTSAPVPGNVATGSKYEPPLAQGAPPIPHGASMGVVPPPGIVPPGISLGTQQGIPQGVVPPASQPVSSLPHSSQAHAINPYQPQHPPVGVVPPKQGMVPPQTMPQPSQNAGQQSIVPPQNMMPPQNIMSPQKMVPQNIAPQNMVGPPAAHVPPMGQVPPQHIGAQPMGMAPGAVPPRSKFSPQGPQATKPSDKEKVASPRINVNVPRTSEKVSVTSPYIPNAGPYAPSNRGHSRTSSIIGGRAKEGNPYAPVAPSGPNSSLTPAAAQNYPQKGPLTRNRGRSVGKHGHGKAHIEKIENPMALLERQFPIFHWSASSNIAYLIPHAPTGFGPATRAVTVTKCSSVVHKLDMYNEFPGPLTKSKSKKKDIEAWLEKNIKSLEAKQATDELLLAKVLLALLRHDSAPNNSMLNQNVASVLNPQLDYSTEEKPQVSFMMQSSVTSNASKLDNSAISTIASMLQVGDRENAMNFAISRQDWALSLVIAHSISPEKFAQVASHYSKAMFPLHKNTHNKTYHLMSIMLRCFAGNTKSLVESFSVDPNETEFAKQSYREIIAAALVNGVTGEFFIEYGGFLASAGITCGSEICYMLAGVIMSRVPLQNGNVFLSVGSFTQSLVYTEIYEYILQTSPMTSNVIPPTGIPHLIEFKIHRAQVLADLGHFTTSKKYCDAINSTLKVLGKSPLVSAQALAEFQSLVMRLSETSSSESGWLGSKLSKVNLDKVWGQLDKFIGGEEGAAKPAEKGVFSKFSPSLSRNTSALDITQIPIPHLQQRQEGSFLAGTPSDIGSPSKARTQTHLRYAPTRPNAMHSTSASSPAITNFTPPASQNGNQRHILNQSTPIALPHHDTNRGEELRQQALKHGAVSQRQAHPIHSHGNSAYPNSPYGNQSGHMLSLSIASGHGVSSRYAPSHEKRNSVGSVSSVEHSEETHRHERFYGRASTHSHSRESFRNEGSEYPENATRRLSADAVPNTINESGEFHAQEEEKESEAGLEDVEEQGKADAAAKELAAEPEHRPHEQPNEDVPTQTEEPMPSQKEELEEESFSNKPENVPQSVEQEQQQIPKEAEEPKKHKESHLIAPPPKKGPAPKRNNPYAPGGSRTVSRGSNKYGPPGGGSKYGPSGGSSKYGPPETALRSQESKNTEYESSYPVSTNPVLEVSEPQKSEADESALAALTNSRTPASPRTPAATPVGYSSKDVSEKAEDEENKMPSMRPQGSRKVEERKEQNKSYAPPPPANVDVSFEEGPGPVYEAPAAGYESPISKKPLILNTAQSPAMKEFANPFQHNKTALIQMEGGLEDFSIPGSPEYTTRANSVIGNNGLYSSRLSQSQQTELYHQYEVKDDTVLDYIPVEEDEEDEEEARIRKEAQAKKEKEAEQRRKSEPVSRNSHEGSERTGSPGDGSGWFKGWLPNKKGDDKPKPIKAKLGQANTFKYDEKLKRWIDTSRPLEEQLKAAAPPPPPKKKNKPEGPSGRFPPTSAAPEKKEEKSELPGRPPRIPGSETGPGSPGGRRLRSPPTNLANAGLDDLLSLGASAPSRKGKRRYVNIMEK